VLTPVLLLCQLATTALAAPPDAEVELWSGPWMRHAIGDLDADGIQDVLWSDEGDLRLWSGALGAPPPAEPSSHPTGGTGTTDVLPGDFDGDGVGDALVTSMEGGALRGLAGLTGTPDGPVATGWVLPDSYRAAFPLGDIDGDGDDDLLIDGVLWKGGPSGPTEDAPLFAAFVDAPLMARSLGDLDGDGYPELAIQGASTTINDYGGREAELLVFRGTATGFDPTPWWSHGRPDHDCGWEPVLADVDADGVDELVVVCVRAMDESAIGTFDVLDDIGTATPTLLTRTPLDFDVGSGFDLEALDDWDDDGADEVILAAEHKVRVLPWDPKGGLDLAAAGATEWTLDTQISTWLSTDDISGDGRGDLVVTWYDSSTAVRSGTVWLGPLGTLPVDTGHTGTPSGTAATGDTGSPVDTGEELDDGPICGCTQAPPSTGVLALLLGPLWMRARRRQATPAAASRRPGASSGAPG